MRWNVAAKRTSNGLTLQVTGEFSNISTSLVDPEVTADGIRFRTIGPELEIGGLLQPGFSGSAMQPIDQSFSVLGEFGDTVRVKIDGHFEEVIKIS